MDKPNVIVLDIETKPMRVLVWDIKHDQYISPSQVEEDWSIIAWCAKKLGSPASQSVYRDARNSKDLMNDKPLLKDIWKMLDEADIVITQNGKKFDIKKLNARFEINKMGTPSPYQQIDTCDIAKRVFGFTSNSLEYLADKLCTKYKKLKHKKYPGLELWIQCMAGNMDAWNHMEKYNIHDVLTTEELFGVIKKWVPESAPRVHLQGCDMCGGDLEGRGTRRLRTGLFTKPHCTKCGRWPKGVKIKETI